MSKKTAKKINPAKALPPEPIPAVNANATLEIEKIAKASDVPSINANAPLKIEEIEEKEESEPQEKANNRLFILGGIGLGIIVLAVVALFIFFSTQPGQEKTKEVKIESLPTSAEAPKQVVRSEWPFEVLNGSGVAGAAKKEADKLEALGYKVISTGNADASNYTENKLYVTADMANKEDLLLADLKTDFNIASISGEFKSSTTASARLIVGKD